MRTVGAVVESIAKGHRLRDANDIRIQARQLGRSTLVISPPTIRIAGVIGRSKICEVTLDGAFGRDVGRDACLDGIPFCLACGVVGEEHGGLYPVRGEIACEGVDWRVAVV